MHYYFRRLVLCVCRGLPLALVFAITFPCGRQTTIVGENTNEGITVIIWIVVTLIGLFIVRRVFASLRAKYYSLTQRNLTLQKEHELDQLTLEKNRTEREHLEKDIVANEKLIESEKMRFDLKLSYKDRELATKALHLVNKNEVLMNIRAQLDTIEVNDNKHNKDQIQKIKKLIRGNENMDQEWGAFKLHFEEVHPEFFVNLQKSYSNLTENDLRLCAYLLIGLNAKEIAQIYNISPESVRKKKQRLRTKLGLEKEDRIQDLIQRFRKPIQQVYQR